MYSEFVALLLVFTGMVVFPAAIWWLAERDIKARIQARRIKDQQAREESRAHWARLIHIQEDADRNSRQITAIPVVSFSLASHNAGRRRILRLE